MNRKTESVNFLHLMQVLWRRALLILLVGALLGALVLAVTYAFVTPLYDARAYLYVNTSSVSLSGARLSISASELTAAKSLVDTYIVILNTRSTLEEVIARSGVSYTYEELKDMVSAASVNGTEIFYINVTSPNPAEAELLANTIAGVLPDKISAVVDGSSVRIVDNAVRPVRRSSPSYVGAAAKGTLLGMILASALAILLDMTDDKIHDADYLTKTYPDIPVLSVIPNLLSSESERYSYYSGDGTKNRR